MPATRPLARAGGAAQVGRSAGRPARGRRRRVRGAVARAPAAALLVDDVVTTGATMPPCAAALGAAGCGVRGRAAICTHSGAITISGCSRQPKGARMSIDVKGRNFRSTTRLRTKIEKFEKIARQVSHLARWRSSSSRSATRDPGVAGRGGHPPPQGRDAARQGRVGGHGHTRSTWCAEELARQVKRQQDKRREQAGRPPSEQARAEPDPVVRQPELPSNRCRLVDRALRIGEGKKFKAFEKHVARINDFEPEMELLSDDELREEARQAARARAATASRSTICCSRLRAHPRGRQAHAGPAPLRRPADRRHGAARRLDRRDEDRRGQDPHGHAPVVLEPLGRRRASTSSRSTTTSPAATRSG